MIGNIPPGLTSRFFVSLVKRILDSLLIEVTACEARIYQEYFRLISAQRDQICSA